VTEVIPHPPLPGEHPLIHEVQGALLPAPPHHPWLPPVWLYCSPPRPITSASSASATAFSPSGISAWIRATQLSTLVGTAMGPTSFTLPCH
jgi:hypothetical protein